MKDGDKLENAGIDLNLLKNTVMGYYTKKPKTERRTLALCYQKESLKKLKKDLLKICKQINECNLKKYPFGI